MNYYISNLHFPSFSEHTKDKIMSEINADDKTRHLRMSRMIPC
jgi:hypothetical protein